MPRTSSDRTRRKILDAAWRAATRRRFKAGSLPCCKERARHGRAGRRELQLLIEGAGILMLISGDRTYADTGAALAKRLLK